MSSPYSSRVINFPAFGYDTSPFMGAGALAVETVETSINHSSRSKLLVHAAAQVQGSPGSISIVIEGRISSEVAWATLATVAIWPAPQATEIPVLPYIRLRVLDYATKQCIITASLIA